jgi:hypothetical protein
LKTQRDRDLLAEKIAQAQNIEASEAYELAVKITDADSDIAEAAMNWCRTGVMPNRPVIEGMSPESLDEDYYPSQTFILLMMLRRDGENTLKSMAHLPGRDAKPGTLY